MEELIGILTTYPDGPEITGIINKAVAEKLAVCVLSLPSESCYLWEGKIENSKEKLVLFKTLASRKEQLYQEIANNHPYSTPFISYINLNDTHPVYLSWASALQGN